MKHKLTATQIRNAGDGKFEDGGGLRLIRRNGAGKWVFRYSVHGRRREMGLGSQSDFSLAEVRKIRDAWAAMLARDEDPISVRTARREASRLEADKQDPTFKEMTGLVFEARKATLRGEGKRGRWMSPLDLYMIPKIGQKRMSQIHQTDIRDALSPIWKKKHPTAEKAIQRTRTIFEEAKLTGVTCNPFTVDAARRMLGAVDHKAQHHKATPWQDIPDLYAALTGSSVSAICLKWCILTLVRSYGCRAARFTEIDGDTWTVPAERVKGRVGQVDDFRVPLSPAAVEIAKSAAEYANDYVFPGHSSGYVSDVALTKMLRRKGTAATIHGFRATFKTWVQDTDACSWEVSETVLGHTIGNKVERSYARSDLLERRRIVLNNWASFVTGSAADVISLRGTR